MKRRPTTTAKASISNDEAVIRELRRDPEFAVEYLKAAMEDVEDPRVLLRRCGRLRRAGGDGKGCQEGWDRAGEFVSGVVEARESAAFDAVCGDEGDGADGDSGVGTIISRIADFRMSLHATKKPT